MANQVHNIALGQVVAYYRRVDENDPSTAELYVIAWAASDTDDAIKDADTVAAIEALASTAEATNSGYARKVLTDADIVAFSADDTNNRVDLDIPDQTWTAVAAGSNWTDLGIAYGLNGGAGSAKIPLTWHDFAVTPSGTDIVAQIAAAGFFRAS